ncbi:hypothetical protein ACFOQM_11730 [Paenibacillus sp. GCM10012307]|uniref:hypothetical protein n=1 Tax=Paenibacillus sp. GCM10012307 TaxID=3317343 RepID=UPI00361BFB7E
MDDIGSVALAAAVETVCKQAWSNLKKERKASIRGLTGRKPFDSGTTAIGRTFHTQALPDFL